MAHAATIQSLLAELKAQESGSPDA